MLFHLMVLHPFQMCPRLVIFLLSHITPPPLFIAPATPPNHPFHAPPPPPPHHIPPPSPPHAIPPPGHHHSTVIIVVFVSLAGIYSFLHSSQWLFASSSLSRKKEENSLENGDSRVQ